MCGVQTFIPNKFSFKRVHRFKHHGSNCSTIHFLPNNRNLLSISPFVEKFIKEWYQNSENFNDILKLLLVSRKRGACISLPRILEYDTAAICSVCSVSIPPDIKCWEYVGRTRVGVIESEESKVRSGAAVQGGK